jgi:hypothetical protein
VGAVHLDVLAQALDLTLGHEADEAGLRKWVGSPRMSGQATKMS